MARPAVEGAEELLNPQRGVVASSLFAFSDVFVFGTTDFATHPSRSICFVEVARSPRT